MATNLEAVAEKAEDEELCKDLKAEKRKPWSKLDASLVEMEEEAKNQHDVVIPKFEKKMESLKKKSEEDKKAIDATAKEIDAAARASTAKQSRPPPSATRSIRQKRPR